MCWGAVKMRRIAGLVPQITCYYCMPCKRRFAPNGNAKPVFHLNLNLRFPAMVGSWKSQISNHQVWVTQVTQQPQPPQTSRENCNLDNSTLALFLSLCPARPTRAPLCSQHCWQPSLFSPPSSLELLVLNFSFPVQALPKNFCFNPIVCNFNAQYSDKNWKVLFFPLDTTCLRHFKWTWKELKQKLYTF